MKDEDSAVKKDEDDSEDSEHAAGDEDAGQDSELRDIRYKLERLATRLASPLRFSCYKGC